MLIMKCTECEKYISSALLAEIDSIRCEHCGADVKVRNVLVSANGFTFDRNDLLKRFFRYRRLLDEVIDERNALFANSSASDESKRSIEQFLSILQGMMTGARDHFRYQFESQVVTKIHYSQHQCLGHFINLSIEGACVEIASSYSLPRVGHSISVEFSLPDRDELFTLKGSVCWTQQGKDSSRGKHSVGIKFNAFDSELKDTLWNFISGLATQVSR